MERFRVAPGFDVPAIDSNKRQQQIVSKKLDLSYELDMEPLGARLFVEANITQRRAEIVKGYYLDLFTGQHMSDDDQPMSIMIDQSIIDEAVRKASINFQEKTYLKVVAIGENCFVRQGLDDALRKVQVGDSIYVERCHANPIYHPETGALTKYFYLAETQVIGVRKNVR
jgi:hypothetical protein